MMDKKTKGLIRQRKYHDYGRSVLRRYKVKVGCIYCGYKKHHAALEFNHRDPKEKFCSVASLANCVAFSNKTKSKKRVKLEISKCDVVCSVCHSIITFEQKHQHGLHNKETA